MWVTERAARLARQPLRWAGDTDPGTCERCGAEGAVETCLFITHAWRYDLCDSCWWGLHSRMRIARGEFDAWYAAAAAAWFHMSE